MSNLPTGGSDFRRGQIAAYENILSELANMTVTVRREIASLTLPSRRPMPQARPVGLWQVNDAYLADPRRILDEHRPRWWQRLLGRCGCGGRLPCPAVESALDVLFMRRRWNDGYGDA
jgi:hypothetical protein